MTEPQSTATPAPDAAATIAPAAAPGSAVPPALASHPRYRVLELLGTGGMGAVYKAEHLLMERTVALKVINRNLIDNPAMVERFRREVKAAAKLSHSNIVTAHDAEQAGDTHFLVMEYVEGTSLDKLVKQGPLPIHEACEYVWQAALGLQHAHERGMVHRDIKPQNLMLTPDGQIKVLDFGLARFAMEQLPPGALLEEGAGNQAASITQVGTVMGTPDYIAPEQVRDAHTADIRADIYSLGCTLYDLLAGKPPFPEGTAVQKALAHVEQEPRPLTELRKDVPPELARVVGTMMAKEPAERYQTPVEVVRVLRPFMAESVARMGRSGSYTPRWGGHILITASLMLPLLLIAAFSGLYYFLIVVPLGKREADLHQIHLQFEAAKKLQSDHQNKDNLQAFLQRHLDPDQARLQGTWVAIGAEAEGLKVPDAVVSKVAFTLAFTGDTARLTANDVRIVKPEGAAMRFYLDPTKEPKTIDFVAPGDKENTLFGIYRFEGDLLRICGYLEPTGFDRPTEFATKSRKGMQMFLLQRVADAAAKSDKERIQGRWKPVSGASNGQPWTADMLKAYSSIAFDGDRIAFTTAGEVRAGTFKLDPDKNPKEIDMIRANDEKGMRGIYKLDGDTLTICQGEPGTPRPTDFETRPGTPWMLLVLLREPVPSTDKQP